MVASLETDQPFRHHTIVDGIILIHQYLIATKQRTYN